jgi:hypothetical protein
MALFALRPSEISTNAYPNGASVSRIAEHGHIDYCSVVAKQRLQIILVGLLIEICDKISPLCSLSPHRAATFRFRRDGTFNPKLSTAIRMQMSKKTLLCSLAHRVVA